MLKQIENTLEDEEIKDIRRHIFQKEDEAERKSSQKGKEKHEDAFFNSQSETNADACKSQNAKNRDKDSFFDNEEEVTPITNSTNRKVKGYLSDEDFNF